MSFRGNPHQKFSGPSPWLQGCPPNMRSPCLPMASGAGVGMGMQGRTGPMASPNMNQNFGNNLVNQLVLANSLLSNAFSPKSQGFGSQCGGSLLGSPPINFNMQNRLMSSNMMSSNLHMQGPDAKRMRYSNQNSRNNSFQQGRNRQQGRNNNSNYNKRNKYKDDNRNRETENKKEDDKNKKSTEDKEKDKEEKEDEETQENDTSEKVEEDTYDPASPTSDTGHIESTAEEKESKTASGQKRPRSPSPQNAKDTSKGTLQVTIQQGSQGRSVSKDGETGSGASSQGPMFCHVCNVSCGSQENFHKHMNSKNHKLKMDSLITLHEAKTKQLEARMKVSGQMRLIEDKERGRQKTGYCNICKNQYTGTLIEHKRTKEHKKKREVLYPFCRKCNIKRFQNRDEYEEHCKTEAHKKACEEWDKQQHDSDNALSDEDEDEQNEDESLNHDNENSCDKEQPTEDSEEKGKKEDSGDATCEKSKKDESQKKNPSLSKKRGTTNTADKKSSDKKDKTEPLDLLDKTEKMSPPTKIDPADIPPFNPEQLIGQSYIVPLSGLFCKLCRKFYRDNISANAHCQSKLHYDNYKKTVSANPEKSNKTRDQTKLKEETALSSSGDGDAASKTENEAAKNKDASTNSSGNCKQDFSDERILSDIDEILGNSEYSNLVHSNQLDKASDSVCSEGDQLDDMEDSSDVKSVPSKAEDPKEATKAATPKRASPRGKRGKGRGKRS